METCVELNQTVINSKMSSEMKAHLIVALDIKKKVDELARLHGCTAQEYLNHAMAKTRESL